MATLVVSPNLTSKTSHPIRNRYTLYRTTTIHGPNFAREDYERAKSRGDATNMAFIMMFFGDIIESKHVISRSNSDSDPGSDSSRSVPFAMKDISTALDSCIGIPKIAPFGMNEIVPGIFLGSEV